MKCVIQIPHYTEPKKNRDKQRETGMIGNGWSVEGLEKFNEIATQVKKDRINLGEEFNIQFKSFMVEQWNRKQMKKQKRMEISTYNDLNGSDNLHPEEEDTIEDALGFDTNDLLPSIEEV